MSMLAPSFALINGATAYNYDNRLNMRSYAVNRAPVTQEWTDANWIRHRPIVRERVTGTIHLGFKDKAAYDGFLARLAEGKNADGVNRVRLLVLNSGAVETLSAFVSATDSGSWDVRNAREWHDVTVKIEEA